MIRRTVASWRAFSRVTAEHQLAAFHHIDAVGVVGDMLEFGFGDQHGAAEFHDLMNRVPYRRDNRRRQPLERLVKQQQVGIERQSARN